MHNTNYIVVLAMAMGRSRRQDPKWKAGKHKRCYEVSPDEVHAVLAIV